MIARVCDRCRQELVSPMKFDNQVFEVTFNKYDEDDFRWIFGWKRNFDICRHCFSSFMEFVENGNKK